MKNSSCAKTILVLSLLLIGIMSAIPAAKAAQEADTPGDQTASEMHIKSPSGLDIIKEDDSTASKKDSILSHIQIPLSDHTKAGMSASDAPITDLAGKKERSDYRALFGIRVTF